MLPLLFAQVQQAHVDPRTVRLPVVSGSDIRFTRLSTSEGLSQIKVSEILQDNQGFMWFGTQYGLNRFDGYNFKVFVHDPRDANSLSGVLIDALFKDRDGTLWVGCDQFVNRFDRETETFRQYPVPHQSGRRRNLMVSHDQRSVFIRSGDGTNPPVFS
jgi:ligand-binding sensor domain-containing protein